MRMLGVYGFLQVAVAAAAHGLDDAAPKGARILSVCGFLQVAVAVLAA